MTPPLPLGPYRVLWPEEQGGMFAVWGREDQCPPEGWAIPLVAAGTQSVMEWLAEHLNALASQPEPLDAAWKAAEAALGPSQRLVMWQDRGGPRFIQVLAPDLTVTDDEGEPVDDVMSPVISVLADYPSKGLGKGVVAELYALSASLGGTR